MNSKRTIPIIIKIVPPLAVGILFFVALKELFSGKDDEKKPEKETKKVAPLPNFFNSSGDSAQKSSIPGNPPGKATMSPTSDSFPAYSIPTVPEKSVKPPSVIAALKAVPKIQLPAQKKVIVRADMANIFSGGTRRLTRTAAVSALKALGFGKTAAYAALSPDGRFSAWLQCAPDGTITWKC